jgi:hypothetical protein
MTTLNELLAQINAPDKETTKTASVSQKTTEKDLNTIGDELGFKSKTDNYVSTKTASQGIGGQSMNYGLHTLYNDYFSDENGYEKVASEGENTVAMEKEAAATEGQIGETAGLVYNYLMQQHIEKLAMEEAVADSGATQERNQTEGVISGAQVAQPQLEVNRPLDASTPIDTTPQTTDLMDAAVAKEMILRKLEEGTPGDLSHKTMSVDMGLEMPTDQRNA